MSLTLPNIRNPAQNCGADPPGPRGSPRTRCLFNRINFLAEGARPTRASAADQGGPPQITAPCPAVRKVSGMGFEPVLMDSLFRQPASLEFCTL